MIHDANSPFLIERRDDVARIARCHERIQENVRKVEAACEAAGHRSVVASFAPPATSGAK